MGITSQLYENFPTANLPGKKTNRTVGDTNSTGVAHDLSELYNAEIWSKLENLQLTGAFKLRGAINTILQLNEDEQKRGVVDSSTGNH